VGGREEEKQGEKEMCDEVAGWACKGDLYWRTEEFPKEKPKLDPITNMVIGKKERRLHHGLSKVLSCRFNPLSKP
jgi:hypothetical protein